MGDRLLLELRLHEKAHFLPPLLLECPSNPLIVLARLAPSDVARAACRCENRDVLQLTSLSPQMSGKRGNVQYPCLWLPTEGRFSIHLRSAEGPKSC